MSIKVKAGLLGNMYNSQKGNAYIKAYGSTQDLETAAAVFKFAADNTSVEWKLDVYDDNSIKTVVVTDKSEYYVNGTYAQKQLQIEGERIIDIHSHLSGGTKGGAGNDFNLAKPKRKNAVYIRDSGKEEMLYEYNNKKSQIKSIPIFSKEDLLQYIRK